MEFVGDLLISYGVSGLVVYAFHRIRQSPTIGFLVAGILIGPNGLSLISDSETVHNLAGLGLMLLLFSVGLEFSIRKLRAVRNVVLLSGPVQILSSIGLIYLVGRAAGLPISFSLILGFLAALSSTAVVVKLLADRGELESYGGQVALGLLMLQDLAVVPMIATVPSLVHTEESLYRVLIGVAAAFGLLVLVFWGARYFSPRLFGYVVGLRSRELFVTAIILVFFGMAFLVSKAGFSMGLGAFLAGLVLSSSEHSQRVFSEIRPVRDSLNSLFFVSIGMLVSPLYVLSHLPFLILLVLFLITVKAGLTSVSLWMTGIAPQVALAVGITTAQVGEFSFIMLEEANQVGLVPEAWYQNLISVAVASMALTPALLWAGRRFSTSRILKRLPRPFQPGRETETARPAEHFSDHVILCGFGITGKSLALILKQNRIPYIVLELNPETVRTAAAEGEPIRFGDCTDADLLGHAGIGSARVILFAISDPVSLRRGLALSRSLNPNIVILARTKRVAEIDELYNLGANEIVTEEFESSIELLTRILRVFNFPRELIAAEVRTIREDRYGLFRPSRKTVPRLRLSGELEVFSESVVVPDDSPIQGMAIRETQLRQRSGALILGLIRRGHSINNPLADEVILSNDLLVLSGTKEQLRKAMELIKVGDSTVLPAATGEDLSGN